MNLLVRKVFSRAREKELKWKMVQLFNDVINSQLKERRMYFLHSIFILFSRGKVRVISRFPFRLEFSTLSELSACHPLHFYFFPFFHVIPLCCVCFYRTSVNKAKRSEQRERITRSYLLPSLELITFSLLQQNL